MSLWQHSVINMEGTSLQGRFDNDGDNN